MELWYKFLVIGNNPEEIIEHFNAETQVAPYPALIYDKAGTYRLNKITTLKEYLKSKAITPDVRSFFEEELNEIIEMSDDDFYAQMTYGLDLDEHLNYISTENPEATFKGAKVATENEAYPFVLKDGTKTFKAKVGDIDWEATKTEDGEKYSRTWDLIVKHAKVETEEDAKIYRNYDSLRHIAAVFKTKEKYVEANTVFFTPYVATKENGKFNWYCWNKDEFADWILSYNKKFLSKLSDDTFITLYATKELY